MAECCCTHSRTTGRKFFLSDDQSPAADSGLLVLLAHSTPAPPTPERHGKGSGRSPPSQAYQRGSKHDVRLQCHRHLPRRRSRSELAPLPSPLPTHSPRLTRIVI